MQEKSPRVFVIYWYSLKTKTSTSNYFSSKCQYFPLIVAVFHLLTDFLSIWQRFLLFRTEFKTKITFVYEYSSHKRSWLDCTSELSPPGTQRTSADCADLAFNITPFSLQCHSKKQLPSHRRNQIKRKQLTPCSFKQK